MNRAVIIVMLGVLVAVSSGALAIDGVWTSRSGEAIGGAEFSVPEGAIEIDMKLTGADTVWLTRADDGRLSYYVVPTGGGVHSFDEHGFSVLLYEAEEGKPWWKRVLNISNPIGVAWVAVGLLGQLLFTGRMLVQWLVSEKEKRSVVPPVFWWMSLIGASMLLVYFGWRKDIVGILGQATGWFIYVRNLYFIRRAANITDDPAPAPELAE